MHHLVLAIAVALNAASAGGALAASSFDGDWSVLVITEKGGCDRAFRYRVGVAQGRIGYRGAAAAQVAGTVTRKGAVNVTISLGNQSARGIGSLTGTGGRGTWRGTDAAGACSGHWEAERR